MNGDVLIVDDDPETLQLLAQILSERYNTRAALSGRQALESIHEELPDLILLDVLMPEMDGYEVCRQLKADKRSRDIPVLFISGVDGTLNKVEAFSAGGIDYITKPFQVEEIQARVESQLTVRYLHACLQNELCRRKQADEALRKSYRQLREKNQQLQAMNRQLEEVNASKDRFFTILAHDLRSPFTNLLLMSQILQENLDIYGQESIRTMIGRISTSSQTIYALLTKLLEWSRLERGLLECEPDQLVLAELVEQAQHLLASSAAHKQVRFCQEIPQDLMAYADEKMIATVVRNLLSNALKFSRAGDRVSVTASRHTETVEIAVTDTGIGMPPERMENVFQLGSNQSTRGTSGEKGSGLGLILCKELVEKNGGTLQIKSEIGKGTTVTFTLPAKRMYMQ